MWLPAVLAGVVSCRRARAACGAGVGGAAGAARRTPRGRKPWNDE